jgi:hypothetical protein
MRKEYKIKVTKKLLKQLRPFWQEVRKVQDCYDVKVRKLEEEMAKKTHIENIEFFYCDNEIAGIGNAERTMPLIHHAELDK